MENSRDLFSLLVDAVVALDPVRVAQLCQEALRQGLAPEEALEKGLARGMRVVGEKFAAREFFVPEVLLASKAMYAGFDILKEQMPRGTRSRGRVALGVVQGDIHDIGKNIVKVMVQAAGFEVVDLGRNVPIERFVTAAEEGVQIVGMSSLMTTTMPNMAKVIEALKKQGLRERVKVLVGGAPVTRLFAERIGADGYAPDAHSAVVEVERLLK
ncbi:MAG: corrinoid protein [candidate division WOR-3 bacterium]|nr:corrinoid protein [candidate division WOR-3 bacterium]